MNAESTTRAVREAAGFWDETPSRARIRVTGRDRAKYLQNMLSQDVKALAPGETAGACALTMKAKLVADMRVTALDDAFVLDVDARRAAAMLEHLRKFVVINQVIFEELTGTCAIALEGPKAESLIEGAKAAAGPTSILLGGSLSGENGYRIVADADGVARAAAMLEKSGVARLSGEVVEALRIENGVPAWGSELSEDTFPPETGLEASALSSTKGCYLGQEPIARLHFLGHVNKHLHGLALAPDAALPEREAKLFTLEGKEVGRVTSAARSIALGRPVALAYVRREASAPGTRLRIGAADAATEAEVRALPLVAPTSPPLPRAAKTPAPSGGPGAVKPGGGADGGMLLPGKGP